MSNESSIDAAKAALARMYNGTIQGESMIVPLSEMVEMAHKIEWLMEALKKACTMLHAAQGDTTPGGSWAGMILTGMAEAEAAAMWAKEMRDKGSDAG